LVFPRPIGALKVEGRTVKVLRLGRYLVILGLDSLDLNHSIPYLASNLQLPYSKDALADASTVPDGL